MVQTRARNGGFSPRYASETPKGSPIDLKRDIWLRVSVVMRYCRRISSANAQCGGEGASVLADVMVQKKRIATCH
jgi:hypothetical protein